VRGVASTFEDGYALAENGRRFGGGLDEGPQWPVLPDERHVLTVEIAQTQLQPHRRHAPRLCAHEAMDTGSRVSECVTE